MVWTVCFYLAIAVLALAVVFTVVWHFCKGKAGKGISLLKWFIAFFYIAGAILAFPIYKVLFEGKTLWLLKAIMMSILDGIRLFIIDADFLLIYETVYTAVPALAPYYAALASLFFVLCPLFTFGFILSFFKNVSASIKLAARFFSNVYVFSSLNGKSVTLAKDLKKNDRRRVIVFCSVDEEDTSVADFVADAKNIGAILFKKDILNVNFKFHSSVKKLTFFCMTNNDSENNNHALRLINDYGNLINTNLYLFSSNIEGELLLSSFGSIKMKVRRVNEKLALINREMYYNGYKLFRNAKCIEGEADKKISAVVVGLGGYGKEMVKTLVWFGQMDGYKIEIDAFDVDEAAEDKFTAQCPEIMSKAYNGVYVNGEAQYKVTVHSGVDVNTATFAQKIQKLKDATYVFISLGSEELNIKTAVNLRMLFERVNAKPSIQAVIHNSRLKRNLKNVTNFKKQQYNVELIGDLESSYLESVIMDNELEAEALKRHVKYDGSKEEEFWSYEYNYRSSVASAIHLKARCDLGVAGAEKTDKEMTVEERDATEKLEHRRWNAYMRAQGYVYSGSPDKSTRNDLAKMHHDLVVFNDLSETEKRKDSRVASR